MEIKGQQVSEKSFDVLIVGGGGSGLRAALEISKSGLEVAVISKVFPTRSHTVAAQGGITCAIASADPDDDWHSDSGWMRHGNDAKHCYSCAYSQAACR